MESPPTNCPRCEAMVPFRPQRMPIDDKRIEVFIRCKHCNYKQVLRVSNVRIEQLIRVRNRLASVNRYQIAKHGAPSSVVSGQLKKIRRQIRELESEIADN